MKCQPARSRPLVAGLQEIRVKTPPLGLESFPDHKMMRSPDHRTHLGLRLK
jgi:hypothetical protein